MRHRKRSVRFGRQRSHYKATLRNLVRGLVINKRIVTTKTRAKEGRRLAEKLVTIAREKTVNNRRRAYDILRDRNLVAILFNEIAPLFKDRNGGYTRIILSGRRRGDNAQMAILEFVEMPAPKEDSRKKKVKKERIKKKEKPEDSAIREEIKETEQPAPSKEDKRGAPEKSPEKKTKPERHPGKPGFFKKIFGHKKDR